MKDAARHRSSICRYAVAVWKRSFRMAFRRDLRSRIKDATDAVRGATKDLISFYLRHPVRFLVGGALAWLLYLAVIILTLDIPVFTGLEAALEVSFAISAPPQAMETAARNAWLADLERRHVPVDVRAKQVEQRLRGSRGALIGLTAGGWTMLVAFALLFPALIAAILEQLPGVVGTLHELMPDEVRQFFAAYRKLLVGFATIMFRRRIPLGAAGDAEASQLRAEALAAVTVVVDYWFRRRAEFNVNASFARVVPTDRASATGVTMLYLHEPIGAHYRFLEVVSWAKPVPGVPQPLLIAVNVERPHPGAPFAQVKGEADVVPDTISRTVWRSRGLTKIEVEDAVTYFQAVPFRSLLSVPVSNFDDENDTIGVLTFQVDVPDIFEGWNDHMRELVDLVRPFCYYFAWLEKRSH
jgi:hypothetical protein